MSISIEPIGFVTSSRATAEDDRWDTEHSSIRLVEAYGADALAGLEEFSHIEVVYCFHLVDPARVVRGARHPRGNASWPLTGIFAQRAKNRPNRLGTTICRLLRTEDRTLHVAGLDAVDGTPVLDIKPMMREFLPRGEVRQPPWSHELMRDYW